MGTNADTIGLQVTSWNFFRTLTKLSVLTASVIFLGTVILVSSGSRRWRINDGQQRMVTLSLICASLRRLFTDRNDSRREHLALRVLFDVDENATEVLENIDQQVPRVTPPSDDKTRYNQLIRGRDIGANGKLTQAWHQIESFVLGMGLEKSCHFFDFLTRKLELACLHIPDSVDPNSVYETINCRGKRLDDLDLIRNHLYSYFNSDDEATRRGTVHDNLEKIQTSPSRQLTVRRIRALLFSISIRISSKSSFYRDTRKRIRLNAEQLARTGRSQSDYVYSLVEDLSRQEQVELFRAIAVPNRSDLFIEKIR